MVENIYSVSNGNFWPLEKNKPKSRCNKWKLQVLINGNQRKQKRFTGTYTQAAEELIQWKQKLMQSSNHKEQKGITFKEYSSLWLEVKRHGDIKRTTYEVLSDRIASINFLIGDIPLSNITSQIIESMLYEIKLGHTRSKKKYCSSYRYDLFVRIKQIFERAVQEGLILENPCANIKAPKAEYKQKTALTRSEIKSLLKQLDYDNPIQAGIAICATTGARRGEVANLLFKDVENGFLTIRQSKTAAGVRRLPLAAETMKIINQRKLKQQETHGDCFSVELPVCGIEKCPDPHSLTKWWSRNRKKLGFETICLHELRHSYLTVLAEANVQPSVMQRIAGHSSPITTLKIYTHVHTEDMQKAVNSFNQLISG